MTSPPGFSIDRFRYLRETMPPVAYLTWSYYEHWYFATAQSLLEAGMAASGSGSWAAIARDSSVSMKPSAMAFTRRFVLPPAMSSAIARTIPIMPAVAPQ